MVGSDLHSSEFRILETSSRSIVCLIDEIGYFIQKRLAWNTDTLMTRTYGKGYIGDCEEMLDETAGLVCLSYAYSKSATLH
jgi:hypothetical protein